MEHKINGIVAVDQNWCIGKNNDLPWTLKDDLKHFADTTRGKVVIMGRVTSDSIIGKLGHPLKDRVVAVLSKDRSLRIDGCRVYHSPNDILSIYQGREIYICGGNRVYNAFMDHMTRLVITHIDTEVADGDIWFPVVDLKKWKRREIAKFEKSDRNEYSFRIVEYTRNPRPRT